MLTILDHALASLTNPALGYCILQFGEESLGIGFLAKIATLVDENLSPNFRPIAVFKAHPHWKPIGVNIEIEDYRVGGTGLIPLHIDFTNTQEPPDLVAFLCASGDPFAGGESLLYPISRIRQDIGDKDYEEISNVKIDEGKFYDLTNVGNELRPFKLFEGDGFFRYTGKAVRTSSSIKNKDLFLRVDRKITEYSIRVKLQRGDVLIVNQRLALHGREALGHKDKEVSNERLIYQRFYRSCTFPQF